MWYTDIDTYLLSVHFTRSGDDPNYIATLTMVILLIWVDHMLVLFVQEKTLSIKKKRLEKYKMKGNTVQYGVMQHDRVMQQSDLFAKTTRSSYTTTRRH